MPERSDTYTSLYTYIYIYLEKYNVSVRAFLYLNFW